MVSSKKLYTLWMVIAYLSEAVKAFCPSGCQCDNVGLKIQCVNANLDIVPILLNPGTVYLDLSHNHVGSIAGGFTFYNEMQFLDFSYNDVDSLGSENFASQENLTTLIASNNKLEELKERTFSGLVQLTKLDLRDNKIKYISNTAFQPLANLKVLDLSNNLVNNLTSNMLKAVRGLKVLNMCKNKLQSIASNSFNYLLELKELHLCSNEIVSVGYSLFKNLKKLVHLSLYSNRILKFYPDSFNGLTNLKYLDVHDNLLNEILPQSLSVLSQLEELNLGRNSVKVLVSGNFDQLKTLQILHISHCPYLYTLEKNVFENLENLHHLEIAFNPELTNIDPNLLQPLIELRELVFRGNNLQTVNSDLFHWFSLQHLDLRDNKLVCNCSLKWLQDLQKNRSQSMKIEDVTCYYPEKLRGRLLANLTDYELECFGQLLIIAICISAAIGIIFLSVLVAFIYYRHCRKMKTLIHDHWPEKIVATWRDPEYEKQIEDEEYTFQAANSVSHIQIPVI